MRTSMIAQMPRPARHAPLRATPHVACRPDEAAAYRCGFRQGYLAAIGALDVLLRMRRVPPELAFERAITFADGALAEWQLTAMPGVSLPPHLVLSGRAERGAR